MTLGSILAQGSAQMARPKGLALSPGQSFVLDATRGIAALLVVMAHARAYHRALGRGAYGLACASSEDVLCADRAWPRGGGAIFRHVRLSGGQ